MKSKSFMLMILSMGFGLIAAIGISQVMGRNKANAQPVIPMGPVLVAADHLDMYTKLTEENVKIENWPTNIIPEDAITSIEAIQNNVTLARLSKGMPLVSSAIVDEKQRSIIEIPDGFKVVGIKASSDSTNSGLLTAGDKVDIIGYFKKRDANGQTQTTAKTFLKGIRVFSINASMRAVGNREEGASGGSAIVNLLLDEKQSEDIYLAQQIGEIKLVMRGETSANDEHVDDLSDLMDWGTAPELDPDTKLSASNTPPTSQAKSSMVIWTGGTPEVVTFEANKLVPTREGQTQQPEDDTKDEDHVSEEDSGDFGGSDGIDRSLEQD